MAQSEPGGEEEANNHRIEADDESPSILTAEVEEEALSLKKGKISEGEQRTFQADCTMPKDLVCEDVAKRVHPVSGYPTYRKGATGFFHIAL
ncbi:hypothetical protein DPMN_123202 [Dreissena polymorpha]|uniref:Uncharacterized protein n=1 Tax=Dreissena polymorpha TaxID=45954 RepID=A0A9D4GR45_DREPO|nr:hypothetical protein DPMN_123202 [Dreissena polymorpha]